MTAATKERTELGRNAAAAAVLLLAIFVLAPRFWEPGGENWKRWAAANILRTTGGFPMLSSCPLYVVYLVPFLSLKYPLSVGVEYVVTHFLVLAALYRMLSGYCRRATALLLTGAWTPLLWTTQSGATVAGIGFLAFYLSRPKNQSARGEVLSLPLMAATLCHSGNLLYLVGNAGGALFEKLRMPAGKPAPRVRWSKGRTAAKIALGALFLLPALHPSKRWDHNYMMIDPAYATLAPKDPLTLGFFQIGLWKEAMRDRPASAQLNEDWYFSLDPIYGGARSVGQAFVRRPRLVLANLMSNVPDLLQVPFDFFTGFFETAFLPAVCIFALIGAVGFFGLLAGFVREGRFSAALASLLGASSLCTALLLTWFNARYIAALLPIGLLSILHVEDGARLIEAGFRALPKNRARLLLLAAGAVLLLAGLTMNEWTCSVLLHKMLSANARFNVRSLDISLALAGALCLYGASRAGAISAPRRPGRRFTEGLAVASALAVFATAKYPLGRAAQAKAVMTGEGFLSESASGPSTASSYHDLLSGVGPNTRILALEDVWLKAFVDADLDKIHNVFGLPPFPDPSGKTEASLRGLDQIWVSSDFSAPIPSISTQVYLRYRLHVEPLLDKLVAEGWTRRDIERYGTIYSAPSAGTPQ